MRIESIYIKGFGCLADKRYEFPDKGACLIVADNETGKSTLAAAILAALCGFPKRKQAGEQMKLSEVYRPWDGDAYAVEMDISAGAKRLRIERDFARDALVVRDRDTGKDISAEFEPDLGLQFLHLPREDFERIAFIRGKEAPSLGQMPSIQARLSALAEGSAEDTGAETAIAALDGARYTLETSLAIPTAIKRLSTSVADKRKELAELDASIDRAGEKCAQLEESKKLHDELSATLTTLDAEYQAARLAEDKSNARRVEELRVELAVGQAETRLGAIKHARQSARQSGASVATAGIALAIISIGMLLLGFAGVGPSAVGALVGIAIAAAGAVRAAKADVADSDEKARLEREIEEARRSVQEDAPGTSTRPSAEIENEQREIRTEIASLNSVIIDLEKRVGATVDAYRRDYPKINDDIGQLERELAKAQRFESAIGIAREVLGEVAEESHRRWAAALNEQTSTILPHLSPNYEDLRFDDSLSFTVKHIPDNRTLGNAEIDTQLSTGAKDQVYLAVRLAFCRELSKDGESIPVLLDDPFLAADDTRFASGMRYLAETFAGEHQVLILSCSRQRNEAGTGERWFTDKVGRIEL